MTRYHIVLVYQNGATACTDTIRARDGIDAHSKAVKMANDLQKQDPAARQIFVGTVSRLSS